MICGAGIIGSAITYYLAEKGVHATVVEKADVACAASGTCCCSLLLQLIFRVSTFSVITKRYTTIHFRGAGWPILRNVLEPASGKAGGFLALDWNDSSAVGPLARLSYALHKELAQSLGQDTGYREVRTFSVAASAKPGM